MAGPRIDRQTADRLIALRGEAWRLARHVLGPEAALAEDAVGEAYLKAVGRLSREPVSELRTWFLRVVVNAARDLARSQRARRRREAEEGKSMSRAQSAPTADPVLVEEVRAALARLDERHRLPLVLRYENGLAQAEVAEVLEVPTGTAGSLISRGLEKVREMLGAGRRTAAPAVVIGALGAEAELAPPASLLATIQAVISTGALPAAKAGAATVAAGTAAVAAWKMIAGLCAAAVLSLGAWGAWGAWKRPGARPPAAPPGKKPEKQPAARKPARSQAIRDMLERKVNITGGRIKLAHLFRMLHRAGGIRTSFPGNEYVEWVRLKRGPTTVGSVLRQAAKSLDLEMEVVEHRGGVAVFFWRRPEAGTMRKLEKLAASARETDRCVAARWLPATGSQRGLTLALKLAADRSFRVRLYAVTSVLGTWWRSGGGHCVDALPRAASPGVAKALARELERIAEARKTGERLPHARFFVRLAGRLADRACLPAIEKIARGEMAKEGFRWVRKRTRGSYRSWSVYLRDPARTRDTSLLSNCFRALGACGGAQAERFLLGALGKLKEHNREDVVKGLALLGTPGAEKALLQLMGDTKETKSLRLSAFRQLCDSGTPATVEKLVGMARRGKFPESHFLPQRHPSQIMLRRGGKAALEFGLEALRNEADPKKQGNLCWNICVSTDAGEKVLPVLKKLVAGADPKVRSAAITSMGFTGSEKAVPVLVGLLGHADRHARSRAALGLGAIGSKPAVDALIKALREGDIHLRCGAAQALGNVDDPRAAPALRAALKAKEPRLRSLVAGTLGVVGNAQDVEALMTACKAIDMVKDPRTGKERPSPYNVPQSALRALSEIGGRRAAEKLVAELRGGRHEAAIFLQGSRDPACRRAFRGELSDRGEQLVRALFAARSTRALKPRLFFELIPQFVNLTEAGDLRMTPAAAQARLLNCGDPRQVEAIARMLLEHKDPAVRARAANLLVYREARGYAFSDPVAATALLKALKTDKDPSVRAGAAKSRGLHWIPANRTLPALLAALKDDPAAEVRQAAAGSLRNYGPHLTPHMPAVRGALRAEKSTKVREVIKRVIASWEKQTAEKLPEPAGREKPPPDPPEVF